MFDSGISTRSKVIAKNPKSVYTELSPFYVIILIASAFSHLKCSALYIRKQKKQTSLPHTPRPSYRDVRLFMSHVRDGCGVTRMRMPDFAYAIKRAVAM